MKELLPSGLNFKKSNIRIWIHQRNMANLQQLLWEGQGGKLLVEHSNNPKMKKFLEAVPHIMGLIKEIHVDTQHGDLESLKNRVVPPIPSLVLSGKDANGLTPLHKAAGLDKQEIADYLLQEYPESINATDNEGRTPLHYAALLKDDGRMMTYLIEHGADESALDNKQKTAAYYKTRHNEIDSKLLTVVPECPRSAKEAAAANFDWSMLTSVPHINGLHNGIKKAEKMLGNAIENHISGKPEELKDEAETKNGNDDNVEVENNNDENVDTNNTEETDQEADNDNKEQYETPENTEDDNNNDENSNNVESDVHPENDESTGDNEPDNNESDDTHDAETHEVNGDDTEPQTNEENHETDEIETNEVNGDNHETENNEINGNDKEPETNEENVDNNDNEPETHDDVNEVNSADEQTNEIDDNGIDNEDNLSDSDDNAKREKRGLSKHPTMEADIDNIQDAESEEKPKSKSSSPSKSRPVSRVDSITRSNSQNVEKSRPASRAEKSRNNSESESRSRSISPDKTRTRSVSPNKSPIKSRPGSKMVEFEDQPGIEAKSRPESKNIEKSRPGSKVEHKSRPSSKNKISSGPIVDGEGVIEGMVHGEGGEKMNNEGSNRIVDTDDDVKALVASGNMEQMAALVLNGEGEKLVGQRSDNTELQSFLENVPVYMSKINRIHQAARDGSLRDLQAALDRRKFAIAKDAISPKGCSPLHVAVIFGNTSIVRYLAGRFPETSQVTDDDGRTPLHYAAVLKDNGHYYNLLVHLGADMRIEDNFGHTPEYYRKTQTDFSHKQLLKDFGAEEKEAEEILTDKVPDDVVSARKDLDDEDMISVLERCYNVLQGRRTSLVSNSSAITSVSTMSTNNSSFLSKHCKRYVFDNVKLKLTKLDHNLYDLIWPSVKKLPAILSFRNALEQDFPLAIVAPDYYVYKVFKEFLEPIIKDYNYIDLHQELQNHPDSIFTNLNSLVDYDLDLDTEAKWIISGTLDCTRNLADFELPKSLNYAQLELVERLITTVLLSKDVAKALYPHTPEKEIEEKGSGIYYTMNEVLEDPSEARILLASNNLLIPLWNIPDSDRLHGKFWPYGRGVFVSNGANLAVWINVLDHLRIVTCTPLNNPGNVGLIFSRLSRLMSVLEKHLDFCFDNKLGYLSARPSCLGNTLQFNLTIRFPYLIKEPDNLRHLCVTRGLTYHRNTNTTDVVRIGNQQCLGVTETQCFEDFTTAVANILQLEKDMAMSNSLHIAAMFLNIFKKKKLAQSA